MHNTIFLNILPNQIKSSNRLKKNKIELDGFRKKIYEKEFKNVFLRTTG